MRNQSFFEIQSQKGTHAEVKSAVFQGAMRLAMELRRNPAKDFFATLSSFLLPNSVKTLGCRHYMKKKSDHSIEVFGESHAICFTGNFELAQYCPKCFANMSIKCPKCAKVILIGDRIEFFQLTGDEAALEDYRTKSENTLVFDAQMNQIITCACCGDNRPKSDYGDYIWAYPGKPYKSLFLVELSGCASFYSEYKRS